MQAVVVRRFGGPEVLVAEQRPDPEPQPGTVLVELRAAALNWHDVLVRRGQYDVALPRVLGADGAGVRRDTGEEVIILPSLGWGPVERAPSPGFEILGDHTDGTYAELVRVPAQNVFSRPAGWSWSDAAALPLAGLTAYRALFARGGLAHGETVLILGAGGGVATTAVGLAHMAGARVLVTSSSEAKIQRARELGADGGVLYTSEEWVVEIRELTGGKGVDLVLDSVGSTWPDALATLSPGGRLVAFGATGAGSVQVDVRGLYFGQYSLLGSTMGSPRDFTDLLRMIGQSRHWRPVVDRVLALDRASEAHAVMERRRHIGKLVLEIA